MSDITAHGYPMNVCIECCTTLERDYDRQGWKCPECGFFTPDDEHLFNDLKIENVEDPKTMR